MKIGDVVTLKSNPEMEMTVKAAWDVARPCPPDRNPKPPILVEEMVDVVWVNEDGDPRFLESIPGVCFDLVDTDDDRS